MAQRLNAYEMPVTILLNGLDEVINTDATLDLDFPFNESTVWGDLFSSVGPLGDLETPPFVLYACTDGDLEELCSIPEQKSWLEYRICDSSPFCGLKVRGSCSDVCTDGGSGYPVCDSVVETVHVQLAGGACFPAP
jgi:hypothetical protein